MRKSKFVMIIAVVMVSSIFLTACREPEITEPVPRPPAVVQAQ